MRKKNFKPMIISALLAIGFGATSIGTTFALFTDHADTTINVTAGKVDVSSALTVEAVSSLNSEDTGNAVANDKLSATLSQGGAVTVKNDGTVSIDRMIPGDRVVLKMTNENASNVAIKHRVTTSSASYVFDGNTKVADTSNYKLGEKLTVKFYTDADCAEAHLVAKPDKWSNPVNPSEDPLSTYYIEVAFPDGDNGEIKFGNENADNIYQNKAADFAFSLEAVQGNAVTANTAHGFADTYEEVIDNVTYTVHEVSTPEQFKAIYAYELEDGEKPIYRLTADVNFEDANHQPTDPCVNPDFVFTGTLDGAGHSIKNAAISGSGEYVGLFSKTNGETVVKNITLDNCHVEQGTVAGLFFGGSYYAYKGNNTTQAGAKLTFENVTINSNSSISGFKNIGSLVGNPRCYQEINVKDVTNNANVSGVAKNIGGFFGSCAYTAAINFNNAVNNGYVEGLTIVGGFTGQAHTGCTTTVVNSKMNGDIYFYQPSASGGLFAAQYSNKNIDSLSSMNGKIYKNSSVTINDDADVVKGAGYATVDRVVPEISLGSGTDLNLTNLPSATIAKFKTSYMIGSYVGHTEMLNNVKTFILDNTANYSIGGEFATKAELEAQFNFPKRIGYFLDNSVVDFKSDINEAGKILDAYTEKGRCNFYRVDSDHLSNYSVLDAAFKKDGEWCVVTNASDTSHRSVILNPIWGVVTKTLVAIGEDGHVIAYYGKEIGGSNQITEAKNMHGDTFDLSTTYSDSYYE